MIDLVTYRIRIGSFCGNYHRKRMKLKEKDQRNNNKSLTYFRQILTAILLIIVTFNIIWKSEDNRASKNRQRRGNNLNHISFDSPIEREHFFDLKTAITKHCRANSHHKFFKECIKNNVYPKNLNKDSYFQVAFNNETLNRTFETLDNRHILDKLNACISHYQLMQSQFLENIAENKHKLKAVTSDNRYEFLLNKLENYRCKITRQLSSTKTKKITKLCLATNDNHLIKEPWIPTLNLT